MDPPPGLHYWACSYTANGTIYGITIPAATWDDAERALLEVYPTGTVLGELFTIIYTDDDGDG